MNLLRR